jgi:hypothetical protein
LVASAKANAIVDSLTRLATAYNEPLSAERIEVYTMALTDLTGEELSHGFNRAIRETKWWPKPAELIEFCTGRTSSMRDKVTIDEAWQWAVRYIELFGMPAQTRWELQGHIFHGPTVDAAIRCSNIAHTLAVSAPFYELVQYEVPPMPEILRQTLVAIGGSMRTGLQRVQDAMRGWNSAEQEKLSGKDASFVRRDFDEYCSRAIYTLQAHTSAHLNPGLQLTGHVAPSFPPFTPKGIAVKVIFDGSQYELFAMPEEVAQKLYDRGELPQHLYEEAASRNQVRKERELLRSTPTVLNAVYLGVWKPHWSSSTTPWPTMGRFNVESHDGANIVVADIPMSVGDLNFRPGQTVQFKAALNDVVFDEYKRTHFNLNQALITKETK